MIGLFALLALRIPFKLAGCSGVKKQNRTDSTLGASGEALVDCPVALQVGAGVKGSE